MLENQLLPIDEKRKFQLEDSILIFLLILSLAGVSISDFSPNDGYAYWILMVFIFSIFAILIAWLQTKDQELSFTIIVKEQVMHWMTTLLVVAGAFLLEKSGHLTPESAGLVILLLLALATILDGLRIGWRFSVVGVFLGMCSVIAAFFKYFMWINIVIALIIIAATFFFENWLSKRKKP